jgi:transcriptional regulator with XRE-family HTH domain
MAGEWTAPFGAHLRRLREAVGFTQEELAERAGLSRDAIGALESGRRRHPHPRTVRSLAVGLGLSERDAAMLRARVPKRSGAPAPTASAPKSALLAPLPIPATRLVGRQRELAEVRRLVTGEARLVTLTGPGGVGKTRLALELAWDLLSASPTASPSLGSPRCRDPSLVLPTIAEAVGLREVGGRELAGAGAAGPARPPPPARARQSGAPTRRRDAGRRAPLGLPRAHRAGDQPGAAPAERRARVPGAATRGAATRPADDRFGRGGERRRGALRPAGARRQPRIRAHGGERGGGRRDLRPVGRAALGDRVGRRSVKVLPPEALLARLGAGLGLLAGGPRDQAARLRSMGAAIAWSYDLLDPDEQALFRRLAVFVGGFTLEAAERVHGAECRVPSPPHSAPGTIDLVGSLVEKSLLRRLDRESDEPRFAMLATIQEYGRERLAATGKDRRRNGRTRPTSSRSRSRLGRRSASGPGRSPGSIGWKLSAATCGRR